MRGGLLDSLLLQATTSHKPQQNKTKELLMFEASRNQAKKTNHRPGDAIPLPRSTASSVMSVIPMVAITIAVAIFAVPAVSVIPTPKQVTTKT